VDRIILDTDVASLSLKGRLPPSLPPRLVGRQFGIIFVTLGELTQWVELRRGRPRPQNDTWIAASCLTYGFPLALNLKDFADFAQHEGLVLL
jgi:predicted nucleic acid-binding protein